jgi:hypothetical protein
VIAARLGILVTGAAVTLALAGGGGAVAVRPCTAGQLSGTFSVIRGSAAAGSISYALRLTNRSRLTCFVYGRPGLRLLGRTGRPLPTKVVPARPRPTAVRVILNPTRRAQATARFSPDVPGPGEPVSGRQCEPTAHKVRVTPPSGGGTLVAPILPPTPVCEHGTVFLSTLSRA